MSDEPWPTIDGRPAKPSELAEHYVDMGVRAAKRESETELARLTKGNEDLREALQSWISGYEGWSAAKIMAETGPARARRILASRKALANLNKTGE